MQVILKVSETLLDAPCMFPDKTTAWEPEESLYPENIVGLNESDALQEETSTPVHCKFILCDKLIPEPLTLAPLPNVKKLFTGPSDPPA